VERERVSSSLHDLLLVAAERAAVVQRESCVLIEQQRAVTVAVRDTVAMIDRRRCDLQR
jgi:hypothetical protein